VEEPWPDPQYRSALTIDEIEQRLRGLSARISELLGRWWNDPAGLTFTVHLGGPREAKEYCHKLNSYGIQCELRDATGVDYYGTGLLWFVRLLAEWLWIQDRRKELLVLIDEPATALHPRAQRALARVLSTLAEHHQIIYSTHSPFVIDWNFPQRIRLLERDPRTKQTFIRNKPFAPGPLQGAWDPLRETIGVSLGDLAVIDRQNVLVEGITDQFLIANVSAGLDRRGSPHLNLAECSITPFSDEAMLKRLIRRAKESGRQVVVFCDADTDGGRYVRESRAQHVPVRTAAEFIAALPAGQDASIEDILGLELYLRAVNQAYAHFEWYAPLVVDPALRGGRSLGRFIRDVFEERFPDRHFDKHLVTMELVERLQRGEEDVTARLTPVVQWVVSELAGR
jgi:hypothetical protein